MKRTVMAAACMTLGLVFVAVGAVMTFGPGVGLLVVGACLVALAVLLGWDI